MFNALMEQKTSKFHLQILKNRINKLEQEELKAKIKLEKAQEKVKELELLRVIKEKQREFNDYKARQQLNEILEKHRINREEKLKTKNVILHNKRIMLQSNK